MSLKTQELPHETALRERAGFTYAQHWKPSADLLERTADLAGLTVGEAEIVLREIVSWRDGLQGALSAARADAISYEWRVLLYRYDEAVKVVAVSLAEAA